VHRARRDAARHGGHARRHRRDRLQGGRVRGLLRARARRGARDARPQRPHRAVGHVPYDILTGPAASKAFDDAKVIGHTWVTMPWLSPEQRPTTADGWKRLAQAAARAAEQAHAAGLRFAYHNHDFELAPVEGTVPLE